MQHLIVIAGNLRCDHPAQGSLISLDGKTVKASLDRATAASPLHMLSAWCSDHGGLVLGQTKTETKSGYLLKVGQLEYDCRYSTMHGMPVTGGRGFRSLKPL